MKRIRNILIGLLAVLLLLAGIPGAVAEKDGPENLSRQCTYNGSKQADRLRSLLGDRKLETRTKMNDNGWVSVSWKEDQPVDFVYWEWSDEAGVEPSAYTVELLAKDGSVIEKRQGEQYWNSGVEIGEDVYGVRLKITEAMELCTLIPFSGGAPSDYHPWQPTVEKADFLVISMHPDDDTLFMGSMIPTYGAERGLNGTILYLATRTRVRRTEALNGAWTMGLRTYPLMAGLPDISIKNKEKYAKDFLTEDVERVLVGYIRMLQPEVIMTHDVNGEYGHWQHIVVAEAIQRAVVDAADPTYDPQSAEMSGAWQVKKLYLHLYQENPIFVSATVPLEAFDGRTAWEVAQEAYQCHQSQRLWYHLCNNENENSLEKFGLAFTTVGPDSGVNDMFENIPAEDLSNFIPTPAPTETPSPTPTDTPAPTDMPAPTEAPTPEPIKTAEPTETPAPTEAPVPAATEAAGLASRGNAIPMRGILIALAAALAVLIGALVLLRILTKRRN